jgi:flavin-binding protein dodecin
MSVVKVIELIAEGKSIEGAVTVAVKEASKTLRSIKSVYVQDIQAIVENNEVKRYRVDVKVSFVVEH